jgi:cell division protein FtsA
MDTRIGYPNEHLAAGNPDELTSPMYATGVGLVIKGFETLNQNLNTNSGEVVSHSKKAKGGFFDKILKVGERFFDENETE